MITIIAIITSISLFFINWFGNRSSYEKLHFEEFKKRLIEERLREHEENIIKK